jgi:diacylglycerol kinase family enzyme
LGIYVVAPLSTSALLWLAVDVFRGTWRESAAVSEAGAGEVTLHFPRRKRGAHAVVDGELIRLDQSVVLKVHPDALPVVLPEDSGFSGTP